MEITDRQRRLLELCAIRIERESVNWSLIARQAQDPVGLEDLCQGTITEKSAAAERSRPVLREGLGNPDTLTKRVAAELEAASEARARLVTVLDDEYPANLRLIPNLPPFLFYRGDLREDDARSVAVVGARNASEAGIRRAASMSKLLATQHVTVVSGLARGIDTAAHRAALDAGRRTIAILGTGITRCYPSENRDLAEEITASGALVSQFWPTTAPSKYTFPRRNVVTSGIRKSCATGVALPWDAKPGSPPAVGAARIAGGRGFPGRSGCGGCGGRCTVVLACRPPSPTAYGPFEAVN